MSYIYLMYALWFAAGLLLVLYLSHRRKRKSMASTATAPVMGSTGPVTNH